MATPHKKKGLFGGTFDPPHFGHLNLAIEILEKKHLDEVWFCPAWKNPFKVDTSTHTSVEHRLAMLKLAIEGIPNFFILENEIQRAGPSYTIDTIQEVMGDGKTQEASWFLLLGDDAIEKFLHWREPEKIVDLITLCIGSRSAKLPSIPKENLKIAEAIQNGIVPIHTMEISATRIRKRLQQGLFCGHLLPEKVIDYIRRNRLYS